MSEEARIEFLVDRDGHAAAVEWVRRTLGIYRKSVLDRTHFASLYGYRRQFIESYLDFKHWLARQRRDTMSPVTPDLPGPQQQEPIMSEAHEKSFTPIAAMAGGATGEPEMKHQNETLDEALVETFPASDPIAVSFTRILPETESRPR